LGFWIPVSFLSLLVLIIFWCLAAAFYLRRKTPESSIKGRAERIVGWTAEKLEDRELAAVKKKLSRLVRIKTVSYYDYNRIDLKEHRKVGDFIRKEFPRVWEELEHVIEDDFAYCFLWKGKPVKAAPGVLMAHFDVVPAAGESWTEDPFGGTEKDGFIYGRGTLDTKCTVVGILEAAERLLGEGFVPDRSWYLALGGDEEVFGTKGAKQCADYFRTHHIRPDFILDEGSIVARGMLPGLDKPIALIGIAEKGHGNIVLNAKGEGGHAAMPGKDTPVHILASALSRLNRHPPKAKLTGGIKQFLHTLIPYINFPTGILLSNIWCFRRLILAVLARDPKTNALIRTTWAPTVLTGSSKENVIPARARAIINMRIIPGETLESAIRDIERTVGDPRVEVSLLNEEEAEEPAKESSAESRFYRKTADVVKTVFPEAVVAPFIATVTTDTKHFAGISSNIFRFVPLSLPAEELDRIHGKDERISVDALGRVVRFYEAFIREMSHE
jgi:carboxypeptidase PM20D1